MTQYVNHRGERIGRVPYGFDLAADGVQLVENQDEQRVLHLVAELRAAGYSLRAIADELTTRGIQTKGRTERWSFSTVQRILSRAA